MIKGILLDDASVVTDIPSDFSFAYIRARKIGKDDQKFAEHKDLLTAKGIPFGVFVELDYINPSIETTDEAHPVNQAKELANKDRGFYKLLPFVKIISKDDNPIKDWQRLSSIVSDLAYWYKITFGKRMMGIAGNKSSLEAMIPYLTQNISNCWFDLISPSTTLPTLKAPYGKFPFWEQTLYNQTVPGATKVATMVWPGTLAELLNWNGSLTTIPNWSAVETPPEDDDEETTTVDLTPVLDKLNALDADFDTISGRIGTLDDKLNYLDTTFNTRMDSLTVKIEDFMNGWSK